MAYMKIPVPFKAERKDHEDMKRLTEPAAQEISRAQKLSRRRSMFLHALAFVLLSCMTVVAGVAFLGVCGRHSAKSDDGTGSSVRGAFPRPLAPPPIQAILDFGKHRIFCIVTPDGKSRESALPLERGIRDSAGNATAFCSPDGVSKEQWRLRGNATSPYLLHFKLDPGSDVTAAIGNLKDKGKDLARFELKCLIMIPFPHIVKRQCIA